MGCDESAHFVKMNLATWFVVNFNDCLEHSMVFAYKICPLTSHIICSFPFWGHDGRDEPLGYPCQACHYYAQRFGLSESPQWYQRLPELRPAEAQPRGGLGRSACRGRRAGAATETAGRAGGGAGREAKTKEEGRLRTAEDGPSWHDSGTEKKVPRCWRCLREYPQRVHQALAHKIIYK